MIENASSSNLSSESRKLIYLPVANSTPTFRALETPLFSLSITITF